MRIKRIEIIGFKSFCDKTVVNIEEPITAIVGPNGCGKSNIIDATRWCMGEQSAKHLRGKSMEDVIFAGSDTRGPASMAEVSLTFENVGFSRRDDRSVVSQDSDEESEQLLADLDGAQKAADVAAFDPTAAIEVLPLAVDRDALVAEGDASVPESAPAQALVAEELDLVVAEAVADHLTDVVAEQADAVAEVVALAADAAEAVVVAAAQPAPVELEAVAASQATPLIDYSQYGEVTITRRLFRDGTSEYFINKTPSRLRDITEFFLGTGVGTKAYSIIEQGRVGMIVSAKAEDRRLIIEEAAGITKFKKKKQAAERKMEQTRQNLLRVSDVVDEIDKRLGSLRRQAQKAERYKKYRAELRDIELWSAAHRYLGFVVESGVVKQSLGARSEQRERLAADFSTREAAIVAERAESQIEEKAIGELTQVVFDLDNRVKLGESQVEFQGREAKDLEDRVLQAGGEIESLRVERELAERELDNVRLEATRLESEAGERSEELGRLEEEHRLVRGQLQDAQAELDGARAEIGKAQTDIARAEGNVRSLERRSSDLDMRLARVTEEEARASERHAPLIEQVAELEQKLGGLRQLRLDLADQRQELEARQIDLREQHGKTEAEVETLRTELHRRRSRLQSLIEIQDRYEGFARGTRAVMQHRPGDEGDRKRILGLVADMVSAPAEYEPAVEALLGDRLGSILVESKDVGALAVDFLKKRSEGRSTFIPVLDFSGRGASSGGGGIEVIDAAGVRGTIASLVQVKDEYARVADYLLGDALVVESLQRALELLDAGVRRTMVTLDGDVIDPHGVVTGGSREAAGTGVLQQKREIRELEEISEALDRDLADAQARHVTCKAELQKTVAALEGIRKHAHEGEIAFMSAEKDHARYKAEAERLAERRGQLGRELAEMQAQLADCERESEETRLAMNGARQRAEEAERKQLGLIEGVTMARGEVDDIAARVTDAKVIVAQAGAAQKAAAAQRGRLELHEAELGRRVDKLEKMIGESGARATQLREESTRMSVELVSLRSDRLAAADELSARKNQHEQRMADLQVAEVELREVRQAAAQAASDCTKLEMKRETLESNRKHLEEAMLEKHRVELARELHDYHLRPPVSESDESRLKELRDLIDRMGEINLTAIEEYEELAGRYDFLTSQKKDLESALEQLETAITKINKTSRKLFRETFDAVNAKFQEVFPRLFRGGNAYLRLTGSDEELLDAGVEIFAQPPGKKNTTVEQLSGGEKALTAVAMIFSIFLIKPSPFCILDEVDAPLDEANVGRYNELVRSMTDSSQFIVITHNKRTMEIADSLYGVTMEEPGCSKLVNVNLRGFQPKAKRAA